MRCANWFCGAAESSNQETSHATDFERVFGWGAIPSRVTCDGEDVSPALQWSGTPMQTKSFVLLCDDPDARRASGGIGLFMTFRPTKPRWRKALEGSKRGRSSNKPAMISIDQVTAGHVRRIGIGRPTTIFGCWRSLRPNCPYGAKTRLAGGRGRGPQGGARRGDLGRRL
jgi:hypothetical protein